MRVLIIGGGKIGIHLANLLLQDNIEARVVESRPKALARLHRELPTETVVAGDGTQQEVLETAGIRQTQVVAVVTGNDEVNLVVAGLARFVYNVPRVIGRVNNPKNEWLFAPDMGIDAYLNQADLMAKLVGEELSTGEMITLLKLRQGEVSLCEEIIHPEAAVIGRAVKDLDLPSSATLSAVIRRGEVMPVRGDTVLQAGDEVLAVLPSHCRNELAQALS
jgi:trk system potassium uptake protein TrkA